MNAVEIEQGITDLAEQPFDPAEFPYAFLEAFGNKATTIKRLRAGASNKSDLGGVLQTSTIHILTCDAGRVTQTLAALKASPATAKAKAKFILATDGTDFEAEDLTSGETVACAFNDFPKHFGFFLPLAGISTVRQISENVFDIRATSRLNRLYVQLLKDNPEWGRLLPQRAAIQSTSGQCDITASLSNQLAGERYHFDQGNQDEWRKTVKSIAATLRDTSEIAVEEVVGHVIRRLSNEVKTPGLVKLTAITVPDCEVIRDGFGRCSELLHSAAAALNRPLPRPETSTAEIDALAAWVDHLRQRQGAVRLI